MPQQVPTPEEWRKLLEGVEKAQGPPRDPFATPFVTKPTGLFGKTEFGYGMDRNIPARMTADTRPYTRPGVGGIAPVAIDEALPNVLSFITSLFTGGKKTFPGMAAGAGAEAERMRGDIMPIETFIAANADDADLCEDVRCLARGFGFTIGGGAAPAFSISRWS